MKRYAAVAIGGPLELMEGDVVAIEYEEGFGARLIVNGVEQRLGHATVGGHTNSWWHGKSTIGAAEIHAKWSGYSVVRENK